jgi:hypothetical protein
MREETKGLLLICRPAEYFSFPRPCGPMWVKDLNLNWTRQPIPPGHGDHDHDDDLLTRCDRQRRADGRGNSPISSVPCSVGRPSRFSGHGCTCPSRQPSKSRHNWPTGSVSTATRCTTRSACSARKRSVDQPTLHACCYRANSSCGRTPRSWVGSQDTPRRACVVWHAKVGCDPSDLGSLDSVVRAGHASQKQISR